jgi:hypothetical protein
LVDLFTSFQAFGESAGRFGMDGLCFFAFSIPVWAWIIGGFYGGYIFASTARSHLAMLLEERALGV